MLVSTLNGQEIEIFRAGDYKNKGKYTPADLQQLASDYDPLHHEAPICIGHPALNAPAFGWIKKLRADGPKLFATPGEVNPTFDASVKAGLYKKRSVALLRKPDGKLELRHLGFLGAMPPEVQGLMDATFSAEPFEEIEFSVATQGEDAMAGEMKQSITDALTEFFAKFGPGKGAEVPVADLKALETRLEEKFAADLKAKDDAIALIRTEFSAHQAETGGAATKARVDGVISKLKVDKRWLPAYDKMGVPALFSALAVSATQEIEFASGDKVEKLDPVALFAKVLDGIGKIVPEGKLLSGEPATLVPTPKNAANADPASVQFSAAIEARAKEKSITFNEALTELRSEGKSAEDYGGASAGEV